MAKRKQQQPEGRKKETPPPAQQTAKHRDAQVTIIIGRNGTGKSTFCEKIIKSAYKRALVITYNGAPEIWRTLPVIDIADPEQCKFESGMRHVVAARYEESRQKNTIYEHIYKNWGRSGGGPVIFDDCRGYIGANVDSDSYFRRLLLDFRHLRIDPYFVVHTPSDVPPRVWGFASTVFVGATDSLASRKQISTDSLNAVVAAQVRVNEAFRKAKALNNYSHYGLFIKINT